MTPARLSTAAVVALLAIWAAAALVYHDPSPPSPTPGPLTHHVAWGTAGEWAPYAPTTTTTTTTVVEPIVQPEARTTEPGPVEPASAARTTDHEPGEDSPPLGGSTAGGTLANSEAWGCIRAYESGGTTDTGGDYSHPNGGAYQFLDSTFQSLGYSGSAEDYPPEVQDAAAVALQERSGWGQWTTASICGLA